MKITHIEVGFGVTRNVGNYESIRVDERVRVEVEEGESINQIREYARDWLESKVNEDADLLAKAFIARRK